MASGLFQRNPRNVRIAAWVLAGAAFAAWYQYDKKKEREFSDVDVQQWNQEVLRKTANKSKKQQHE